MGTAVLLLTSLPVVLSPAPSPEPRVLEIWPSAPPDEPAGIGERRRATDTDGEGITRIRFVDTPSLTVYAPPEETSNACCVVVCPGGGYNLLAWTHEGTEVAEWLNSLGVTAAVLQYRVPRRDGARPHPWPLQDVQRALRVVRSRADEWGIDASRVGLLGFSAGGHLTLTAGTHFDRRTYEAVDELDELSARPDFLVPIYAAYLAHPDDPERLAPELRFSKETPPTFMAVTLDDKTRGVDAARVLIELDRHGVEAELHVYTRGGHGYGMRDRGHPVNSWPDRCADWLRASGWLKGN